MIATPSPSDPGKAPPPVAGASTTPAAALAFPGRLGISPEEFADATNIGRTLVYLALQRGEIPCKRIGRRIVIPLSALDAWFNGIPG